MPPLIDQARDASATLHGRVLHQRPTSTQHSVLFDPDNHLTLSTNSELVDILDNASMDVEATAAIKAEQQRQAAPTSLRQHGCQMGTDTLSTTMAARHRRDELNHRSVPTRARGRRVSTLATIDDTADLERGPDGMGHPYDTTELMYPPGTMKAPTVNTQSKTSSTTCGT